ncbi:condensation domain-containing protein [Streptomyces sp. IBSBF 3136]|uniref:condensation domain-containing protein n=1 Tax=Streptomyces sp. IBSBF 3136 TaxID=2903524 RepID=UPI002FDBAFF4
MNPTTPTAPGKASGPATPASPVSRDDLEARRRLEAALLARRRPPAPASAPAAPAAATGETRFRASLAQEGMWDALRGGFGSTPPLLLGALRLRGPLDVPALDAAWQDVVARHDQLRATLHRTGDRLDLVIAPALRLPVTVTALDHADYDRFTREQVDRPVDLADGPLARLHLLRLADDDHLAFLLMHHIIGDGRSVEVLVRDLSACYLARTTGTPADLPGLPVRYGDHAARHRARMTGPRGAEVARYWRERLDGAEPAVLPTDRRPQSEPGPPLGGFLEQELPADVFDALRELARRARTTFHTLGLVAFQTLLARESGQRDISVRVPVSYRDGTDVRDLIADFSNDVVVRTDLSGNPAFGDLIAQVHERSARDFAHHDLPAHLLEPHLPVPGLLDRLFHVQFTAERDLEAPVRFAGLTLEQEMPADPYVSRPLSLRLRHDDRRARVLVAYALDRFSPERIARLAGTYTELIREMAAHPEHPALG